MTGYMLGAFGLLFGLIGVGAGVAAVRSRGDRLQLGASIAVLGVVLAAFLWLGVAWMAAQCNPPPGAGCA